MSSVKRKALAALIDDTEERNGWTDGDVARQADRPGKKQLTKSDISNYRRFGMPTLVTDKMADLARGLRVPPYVVAVAVLADHGIHVPLDEATPEAAIEMDVGLPAQIRDVLLGIITNARATPAPVRPRRTRKPRPDEGEPFSNA